MGTYEVAGKAGREALRQTSGGRGELPDPCRTCLQGGRALPPASPPGGQWEAPCTSPLVQRAGIRALSHSSAARDQILGCCCRESHDPVALLDGRTQPKQQEDSPSFLCPLHLTCCVYLMDPNPLPEPSCKGAWQMRPFSVLASAGQEGT